MNKKITSDTMSLINGSNEFRYEMCRWGKVILEHDLNPFSKHSRSKDFLDKKQIESYKEKLQRIGPIYPLVVFDHPKGFPYIGPLELYYAYEDMLKTVPDELCVYVVILPRNMSREKIIEVSVLLNPDENIPHPLYRLKRLKSLLQLGLSDKQIRDYLKTGKSNAAFATKVRRDLKLCKNDVLYELVTGISPDDNPLQLPRPEKAKIGCTAASKILEKLGDDRKLWKEYQIELNKWISKKRGYELASDENIPYYDRQWYKNERDKPLRIALSLLDEKYTGIDSSIHISRYKPWDISITDTNVRILRVPSVEIDLKKKSDDNLKLLLDVAYKMDLVSHTLKSYITSIAPVDHGDSVRGKASLDDKTIELRSNLSEFDGYNYATHILRTKMLSYSDRHRLIRSLGLNYRSFGFDNSSDTKMLEEIYTSFREWDRENSFKYEQDLQQFSDLKSVLSRKQIYKIIKDNILKLRDLDNRAVAFDEFFCLVFVKSFKMWQEEFDKTKKEANSIILDKVVKKYHQGMRRKKRTKTKKIKKKQTKKVLVKHQTTQTKK